MPYVQRNSQSEIIALYGAPCYPAQEFLDHGAAEIVEFLHRKPSSNSQEQGREGLMDVLSASDLQSIRIIDDLVMLLVGQNVIRYTDLPSAAQRKLMTRQQVRDQLNELPDLQAPEEPLL